ncbi:MAG: iron-containing alcohol dehydrogenase, partial [Clostridia bacterium]|nr:iron-containing alcohol dehydrogenase [Clostridia bacterium]
KTRRLAKEATALIFANREGATQTGQDPAARENMLLAAYKAGVAFSMSYVGYVHAVAHSLGGKYDTPHGFANAVLLPVVLEGYGKSAHKKLHRLGMAAGVCTKEDGALVGASKFIGAIRDLNTRLGIGAVIGDLDPSDIGELARHAAHEANPLYPVPRLMTAKELEVFYYNIADVNAKSP